MIYHIAPSNFERAFEIFGIQQVPLYGFLYDGNRARGAIIVDYIVSIPSIFRTSVLNKKHFYILCLLGS